MAKKRILIVDDEEDVRVFLQDFLNERDMIVDTAGDGKEALEKMSENPADIVLLDIMMPGIDGLECLGIMKKKHPSSAVIMITALKDQERINRAKQLGAYNYIIKPFSLSYLETELTKLIGSSPAK